MNRVVFVSLTILCLLSVLSVTGLIQLVKANIGIIYIRADGSIDPPTAPISTFDNITYTLTNNIFNDSIVIEKDNITVNGQSYTVQGTGSRAGIETGITLSERSNITIKNMEITTFNYIGIWISSSSNTTISGNNITNDNVGIYLNSSSNSNIYGNNITANNGHGIYLDTSSNYNSISANNITNNVMGISLLSSSDYNSVNGNTIANNGVGIHGFGIYLLTSSNDTIYHNNFINNTNQVYSSGSPNVWDNSIEGNYWGGYTGTDNNQDGIGDTPYIIDANNTDHYPLMGTFRDFTVHPLSPTNSPQSIIVISNSTVTDFADYYAPTNESAPSDQLVQLWLEFSVTGQNGTTGFCRLQIPKAVMNSSLYMVLVDYKQVHATQLPNSDNVTEYLYFTYIHSTHQVWVFVPEFPSFLILSLFFITTLLAIIFFRKRLIKR